MIIVGKEAQAYLEQLTITEDKPQVKGAFWRDKILTCFKVKGGELIVEEFEKFNNAEIFLLDEI